MQIQCEIHKKLILNLGAKAFPNSSVVTPWVHHRKGYRQQRGKHPFYSAPRSTEIICAAHRLSRPEIIGRHLRASNEMIHGDFGIMILILRLSIEHYVKNFLLPPIQKFPRHEGVGPSDKTSLGGQTGS